MMKRIDGIHNPTGTLKRVCLALVVLLLASVLMVGAGSADAATSPKWGDAQHLNESWYDLEGSTSATIYYIYDNKSLAAFSAKVNSGETFQGKTVKLMNDIDLSNLEWTSIGNSYSKKFLGTFDGNEHTVSNLKISVSESYVGFFGNAYGCNEIKNLTINNVDVEGVSYVGAVCGCIVGDIKNCHVSGSVKIKATNRYVGGIAGWGYPSPIEGCTVIASSDKGSIDGIYAGGIIGFLAEGTTLKVLNCRVENIDFNGLAGIGGIAGMVHYGATIDSCSIKDVTIQTNYNSEDYTGLVAGQNGGSTQTSWVINNNVENVVAKDGDTPITHTAAPTENTVIGTGVTTENGKITGGTFEVVSAECVSEESGIAKFTSGGDSTFYVGDAITTAAENAKTGDSVEVVKGNVDLVISASGVTVTNSGGGTVKVNDNDVSATESFCLHNYGDLVAKKDATCVATGLEAHYFCDICDKYFTEAKAEVTEESLKIAIDENAHVYGNLIPQKDATHTETGLKAHYLCDCDSYFTADKVKTTRDELTIPKLQKDSTSKGSSVWLTESATQTPTVTPTPTENPTEPETVPTDFPSTQPTSEPSSPVPLLAVIAGLGAVAILRRK